MEVGQTGTAPEHAAAAPQQNPHPDKVKEQETRRAVAKTEEAAAQEAKREREREAAERQAEQRASNSGGVNVRV